MNYKILLLAASALLMGACSDHEQDVAQEVGTQTETPAYVQSEQDGSAATGDMIDGDGSEVQNDNAVVDTRVDTGPANTELEGSVPTPEGDMTSDYGMEEDGSPETTDEATPQ